MNKKKLKGGISLSDNYIQIMDLILDFAGTIKTIVEVNNDIDILFEQNNNLSEYSQYYILNESEIEELFRTRRNLINLRNSIISDIMTVRNNLNEIEKESVDNIIRELHEQL